MAAGGQRHAHAPDHFSQGKESDYALHKQQGGLSGRYKQVREISPKLMFKPRTVQPVASSHTECDIPANYFLFSTTIAKKKHLHKWQE